MRELLVVLVFLHVGSPVLAQEISGERKQWHDVVLTFDGPAASEMADPNPFLPYRGRLRFTFETLEYQGRISRVTSTLTSFINSKGHGLVDEQERPVEVTGGVLTSAAPDFTVDEGAEFRLRICPP